MFDVIEQVLSGIYEASGEGGNCITYVKLPDYSNREPSSDLRELLQIYRKEAQSCIVCQKGAVFLSTVFFQNKVKVREVFNVRHDFQYAHYVYLHEPISNLFSDEEFAVLETLYECNIDDFTYYKVCEMILYLFEELGEYGSINMLAISLFWFYYDDMCMTATFPEQQNGWRRVLAEAHELRQAKRPRTTKIYKHLVTLRENILAS